MTVRSTLTTLGLLLAGTATLHAQAQYVLIPNGFTAADITPDGEIVVGVGVNPLNSNAEAYYWRWKIDPTPTFIGDANAVAVSDDGSVIAGTIFDAGVGADVAARWTQANGWQSIGYLPNALNCPSKSNAYDMTADGSTIVGLSWDGCSGRAFKWTQAGGMVELENLANGHNRASAIAANGSIVCGFAQGTFNRTPAIWDPSNPPLGGDVFDVNAEGELHGMSDDGSVLLGTWYLGNPGFTYDAIYMTDGVTPIGIGSLNPGWGGNAVDISNDRSRIVGYDSLMLATEAWLWTEDTGMFSLQSWLTVLGVPGVPLLGAPQATTPDGSVIVGQTTFGGAWIVVIPAAAKKPLPEPGSCLYYNPGSLVASGTPTLGGVVTLSQDLVAPAAQLPGSTPLLFIGFAPAPNYPCGTPIPGTNRLTGPMELVVDLGLSVIVAYPAPWMGPGNPAVWPINLPTATAANGVHLYFQGAFIPPTWPGKSTLTEGVEIKMGLY